MTTERRKLVPTSPAGRLHTFHEERYSRRRILQMSLALGAVSLSAPLRAVAQDTGFDPSGPMPTPDQILGPFYPVQKPIDGGTDLTSLRGRSGQAQGPVIYVLGRVLNLRGEPCPGVRLEIWQANAAGRYTHPHDRNPAPRDPNFDGYATVVTDEEGRYRFKTVKPGAYPVVTTRGHPISITTSPAGTTGSLPRCTSPVSR